MPRSSTSSQYDERYDACMKAILSGDPLAINTVKGAFVEILDALGSLDVRLEALLQTGFSKNYSELFQSIAECKKKIRNSADLMKEASEKTDEVVQYITRPKINTRKRKAQFTEKCPTASKKKRTSSSSYSDNDLVEDPKEMTVEELSEARKRMKKVWELLEKMLELLVDVGADLDRIS